jgi:hypothetical protein
VGRVIGVVALLLSSPSPAAAPVAVFESAVLRSSAPAPTAVLLLPVVTLNNEYVPIAVFPTPTKVRA